MIEGGGKSRFSANSAKGVSVLSNECYYDGFILDTPCNTNQKWIEQGRSRDPHYNAVYEFSYCNGEVFESGNLCAYGDAVTHIAEDGRAFKARLYHFDCSEECNPMKCQDNEFCSDESRVSLLNENCKLFSANCPKGCERGRCIGVSGTCYSRWMCKDSSTQAYQHRDCTWSTEKFCENGCSNSRCILNELEPCKRGWACRDEDTLGWRIESCAWNSIEHCDYGCLDGTCNESPVPVCEEKWRCKDDRTKAWQNEDCSWSSEQNCAYECYGGDCKPAPRPTYTPGWKCKDSSTRAYQNANGNWSNVTYCRHGCSNGECNPEPHTPGWKCKDSDTRAYQYSDGSWGSQEHCTHGCEDGTCNSAPEPTEGDPNYCSTNHRCGEGEGDCDSDNECRSGLVCSWDEGTIFGYLDWVDVCKNIDFSQHDGKPGDPSFCSNQAKCGVGYGDCDNDSECNPGLRCVQDAGAKFGYPPNTNVCLLTENMVVVPKEDFSVDVEPEYWISQALSSTATAKSTPYTGLSAGPGVTFNLPSGKMVVGYAHSGADFTNATCKDGDYVVPTRSAIIPHFNVKIYSLPKGGKELFNLHVGYHTDKTRNKRCILVYESSKSRQCKAFCGNKKADDVEQYLKNPPFPYLEQIPDSVLDDIWESYKWIIYEQPQSPISHDLEIGTEFATMISYLLGLAYWLYSGQFAFNPVTNSFLFQTNSYYIYSQSSIQGISAVKQPEPHLPETLVIDDNMSAEE